MSDYKVSWLISSVEWCRNPTCPLLPTTMQGRLRLLPSLAVTSPGWEENDWPELTSWSSSQRRNMAGLSWSCGADRWRAGRDWVTWTWLHYETVRSVIRHNYTTGNMLQLSLEYNMSARKGFLLRLLSKFHTYVIRLFTVKCCFQCYGSAIEPG